MDELIYEQGKIGNLVLKNKIIMTSLTTNLSHDTGEISHKDLAFYKERIDGGVGAIITGMMRVDDFYGRKFPYQPSASHSKYIRGLSMLTDLAHASDVKIFAQLNHPGAQTFRDLNHNLQQVAAASYKPELINQESRVMTDYEVKNMMDQFLKSALICEAAGFDGIEIHAGHGYLLHSYLIYDTRGVRILNKLMTAIRRETSKDFAIILRLNFDDFYDDGYDLKKAIGVIKSLENTPIDAIDITCGRYESMDTICDTKYRENGWKEDYIRKIREATSIPLIADNNIKNHAEANKELAENLVDFVGLARPLLADPAWVSKGHSKKPLAPCISCSHCFKSINEFKAVECPINPYLSRESLEKPKYNPANADKTMVVIGAGPAGCELALNLSAKGYNVVVFEKEDRIGGKLNMAVHLPGKARINQYVKYLENRILNSDIDLRLGQRAEVADIKALNPYQVFIATGSKSSAPSSSTYDVEDVLTGKVKFTEKKLLLIGAGENGLELADYLVTHNSVTIAEATNLVGREMEYGTRLHLLKRLAAKNVAILTNTLVYEKDEKTAIFNTDTNEKEANFDAIIKTIRPKTDLSENATYFENLDNPIILGDADNIGKIYDATKKAVEIALRY